MKTTSVFFMTAIFMASCFLNLNAQSYETTSKWKKKSAPAVAIDVNAPRDIAVQSLYDMLKERKFKGKKKKDQVIFEKMAFPSLTTDYINFYANVVEKDNNNSTVCVFITKGISTDFVTSNSNPKLIDNLKDFLDKKYAPRAEKENYNNKIDAQQKKIEDAAKDLGKLRKDLDKKTEKKEKLVVEIADLQQQIQQQDSVLVIHKENLEKIKSNK